MTGLRDLYLGRLALPTALEPMSESLGSEIQAIGESTAVGQRRPRLFSLDIPLHGTIGDTDMKAAGNRMRRQLRSLMQNHPYRLAGVYFKLSFDPERNGWLVIAQGDLSDDTGGITFGEYKLSLQQVFRVAGISTHREGYRVALTDLRLSTSAIDYFGQVIGGGTGFAGLTARPLTALPVGATDACVLERPVTTGGLTTLDGFISICVGRSNGDVISWERPESSFNLGDVVIYDRRGNVTAFPAS